MTLWKYGKLSYIIIDVKKKNQNKTCTEYEQPSFYTEDNSGFTDGHNNCFFSTFSSPKVKFG